MTSNLRIVPGSALAEEFAARTGARPIAATTSAARIHLILFILVSSCRELTLWIRLPPRCGSGGRMDGVAERTTANPIVIIGGGLAGGNAAATLREEGFPGPVVLISREPGVPFGRPPLSKTYLRSEEDLDGWYVRPAGWYAEHDVELHTGATAVAVDPAAQTVTLASGEELGYGKVLIVTGGRNRRLGIPGAG